ncbi:MULTISPECIES: CRISPR-associated endonuclease Cas1 [Pseudanabaena]|uniref:CRISPR-associated endonuclease Cas1 n=2 Tax=Pseudanabaena TaxID=1152 RepID=L8N7H9_9CYAN|nr:MULTISPECIES: CRISPR-associated endonuclease Cas1 [Pseudanabaena]ELS34188.1 RNA-directed DNA polymerase [Pseudanabaena biceps PCC 7429]MDG3493603.1 CRISPR-associated endonuclease Cas1 [Pseudanabaena catenata USMAC16]
MQNFSDKFLSPENFQLAWEKVAAKNGCAGVDRESVVHFAKNSEAYLSQLRRSLASGYYHPMPLRQLFIPKKAGGWRELGVPTVRDRIVQHALLNILHPLLEPQFEACSFAYRPGRSHLSAVRQIAQWRDRGYEWVLDADVVRYFENILWQRLLDEVAERLAAPEVLSLISAWLSVGVLSKEGLMFPQKGISQGSAISPILANVYLDDFDEIVTATGLKLVRYADDFVVMSRSQKRIVEAKDEVADLMNGIGLQLHPDKTRIVDFDRGFRFLGHAFAGKVIVKTEGGREKREEDMRGAVDPCPDGQLVYSDPQIKPTQMQKAMLEALKSSAQPIPPPLFVVLGYSLREVKPVKIESDEAIWTTGMSTLYLVHQGATLRKEQGRFLVQPLKESALEIPIAEVELVLVFGNIQLTTSAIAACLDAKIPVIFLTQMGEYKGQLWNSEFCDLPSEEAQWQRRLDVAFQLETARAIIWGKLMNSKQLLLRLNRKRQLEDVTTAIAGITSDLESVETAETLESLRGYEGIAANRYFVALGLLITNEGFSLTGRTRRPPKDPVNSLLSFGYTLLYNNVLSLILAEGLNPYLGNLHRSDRKETHLAFDLMEEFRSPVVDTLVMNLINKKILRPTDFTYPDKDGGIYLADAARRVFLKHFEERISLQIVYADLKEKISYRRVIQHQIWRYRSALLGEAPYESFRRND